MKPVIRKCIDEISGKHNWPCFLKVCRAKSASRFGLSHVYNLCHMLMQQLDTTAWPQIFACTKRSLSGNCLSKKQAGRVLAKSLSQKGQFTLQPCLSRWFVRKKILLLQNWTFFIEILVCSGNCLSKRQAVRVLATHWSLFLCEDLEE